MLEIIDIDFRAICDNIKKVMYHSGHEVHTERWQGKDISKKPDMVSYELLNVLVHTDLLTEDVEFYRKDIEPNLPWADDHFLERVGGEPLNPGVQWANWPWGQSAARFRDVNEEFNHTYMQRLWPRYADQTPDGKLGGDYYGTRKLPKPDIKNSGRAWGVNSGLRYTLGDLESLVDLLAREPLTRQAYIPLFFPEDTGVGDGGRKPCTLGYQFIMRDGKLHIYYPIRSCDFMRHFRDDCYLAVRLLLWVLDRCRERNKIFLEIVPGTFTMHCVSLHIFRPDWPTLYGERR